MTETYQYESLEELQAAPMADIDLTPRPYSGDDPQANLQERLNYQRELARGFEAERDQARDALEACRAEITRLSDLHHAARTELDEFKQSVVDLALRVQREMDWCDEGVARALRSIGLELPNRTFTFRVSMTYDVTAELAGNRSADAVSEDFVRQSITGVDVYGEVTMDSDWGNVSTNPVDVDVSDVEPE